MNIHSEAAMTEFVSPLPPTSSAARRDKRRAILEAALELFVERGFHGTAVPAVAQLAGVGAGTIYRYFASKEALVNVLYRQWKTAIATHVASALSLEMPPREMFSRFWHRSADFAREHPRAFAFLELHHHSSYLDPASRETEGRVLALCTALLENMQRRQAVKELPVMVIMHVVYGALIGLVRGAWEGRYPLDDEHIAAAETCLWEAIRQ
jgi:AcrR family transcriptional regulator